MTFEEERDNENRFHALNNNVETLTDSELREYCRLLCNSTLNMVKERVLGKAQLRIQVELIRSIRQFDKASTAMSDVNLKLARRIYFLTWVMFGVGLLGALASGWSNLIWWLDHGFRFH